MHIGPEIGMVEYTLQCVRMQHLQQQAANTADHHAHHVGMNHTDRGVAFEQRFVGGRDRLLTRLRIVEYRAYLSHDLLAQGFSNAIEGGGRGHNPQPI